MPPGATAWAYAQKANWFQILEGHIDTAHVSFLHYGGIKPEDVPQGSFSEYQLRQRSAHFEVIDTEGGAACRPTPGRPARPWRIAQWIFPLDGAARSASANATPASPLDDHNTITTDVGRSR
jgi:hypothetical protein